MTAPSAPELARLLAEYWTAVFDQMRRRIDEVGRGVGKRVRRVAAVGGRKPTRVGDAIA